MEKEGNFDAEYVKVMLESISMATRNVLAQEAERAPRGPHRILQIEPTIHRNCWESRSCVFRKRVGGEGGAIRV